MPISEILIVYFAFGAPLAVYHFFETRTVSRRRRILGSLATFLFWIPFAVRLSYRHLTNALFDPGFVSAPHSKRSDLATAKRQEAVETAMSASGCPLTKHDLRVVLDRYVGLSHAVATNRGSSDPGEKIVNLLKVSGRTSDLAARCLARRERMRLEKHLEASRESCLRLFDQLAASGQLRSRAVRRGVELALLLNDADAADRLAVLELDTEHSVDAELVTLNAA